uniref:Uncharacterized protein n=1 Tax=Globisporangium ultimum (strain ATCC 200006 / CBS 805.95 / DAOM BR144) TaxID=431595 RepID=K3X178_GLOUD
MKSAVQAHQSEIQDLVHINAKTLDAFEDDSAASPRPNNTNTNTTETETHASEKSTIQCFSNAFHDQLYTTTLNSHSREILDHTRLMLLSRNAAETDREINQRLQNHPSDVIISSLKSLFASFRQELDAVTLSGFHELFQNSSTAAGDDNQMDALSSLSFVDIESSAFPWVRLPDQAAFEALNIVITRIRKVLRSVADKDELAQQLLHDVMEQGWQDLAAQVRSLQNQSTALQFELQHFVHATWSHLNHSTETLRNSLQLVESETMASISDLNQKWERRIKIILSSTLELSQSIYNQLQSLTSMGGVQFERSRRDHYREVPLETLAGSEEHAGKQTAYLLHQRDHLHLRSENNTALNVLTVGSTKVDLEALRDRFVVVGAAIEYLVAWADMGWGVLKVLKLVVLLWANSYSDLPVVDARGISTIQTLNDAWTMFRCQHDLTSVCYFLVMQADALAQLGVEYLLWIVLGVIGTSFLVLWKHDYLRVCSAENSHSNLMQAPSKALASSRMTAFQSLAYSLFPTDAFVSNPVDIIQNHRSFMDEYMRTESVRMSNEVVRAWRNQTTVWQKLQDQQDTLGILTRTFVNCSAPEANTTTGNSLFGSCSTGSQFQGNSSSLHQFPTMALSATAAFPDESFAHCFPEQPSLLQVQLLSRNHACAAERSVYLTVASWWLFCVVWSGNRFLAQMLVKACGMHWWRYLSANRLELIGFCCERGSIESPETVPRAVKNHLNN